ncbi:MAG TPA: hypothetical protein VKW06_19885 [Candidatus Angelobacter sp.]|nr:hypothetical protein [Candidatus Angelobacter sp.]
MRAGRGLILVAVLVLMAGCGKSSKLAVLLPDAPDGWKAEGGANNQDLTGVGHSSTRSYVPSGNAPDLGVRRVTVQILVADQNADPKKLQEMSIEKRGSFKEQKQVGGYRGYETVPLPSEESHSLDIVPGKGTYVEIVAYRGGAGWDKPENRQSVVAAFAARTDLNKIAATK